MSLPNFGPIAQYNSLTDPNLQGYFSKNIIRKHLITTGLINKKGSIVPDSIYKYKVAQKDQKKHYRQMLAQAIVQEALDIERFRQAQIRNELEMTAKKELVRRMRGQTNVSHNVPPLWPSNLPPLRPSTAPIDKHQDSTMRSQSVSEIVESSRPLEPKPPTSRPNRRYKRKNFKTAQRPKSAKERSPIKREHSPCRITMYYHGKGVHIPFDKRIFDPKDEITVFQQHCGGENLIVYKGRLEEKTAFSFESKRHKEYPFSLTLYINNTYDCRISTCCEYRHKLNVRIGGKKGKFSFIGVSGDKPCYKCIIDEQMKRVTGATSRPETTDEYKEEFERDDDEEQIVIPDGKEKSRSSTSTETKEIIVKHEEEKNYDEDFSDDEPKLEVISHGKETPKNEIPVIHDDDETLKPGKRSPIKTEEKRLEIEVIEEPQPPKKEEKNTKAPKKQVSEETESVVSNASSAEFNWNVKFYTSGKESKSKHNSIVQLQIVGDKDKTRKYKFGSHDTNAFHRGKVETFNIHTKDIGKPKHIIVTNTGEGDVPDLHLDKVELYDEANKKTYCFEHNQAIEKDEVTTIKLRKEEKKKKEPEPPKLNDWKVIVYTSKLRNKMCGTDAKVYLSLIGDVKESEKIFLTSNSKCFESGSVDKFEIKCEDVGRLKNLRIGHDNSGFGPGWHLSKVILQDAEGKQYPFKCKQWLAKDEGDGAIERVLAWTREVTSTDSESSSSASSTARTESVSKKPTTEDESATTPKKTVTEDESETTAKKTTTEDEGATSEAVSQKEVERTTSPEEDDGKWIIKICTADTGVENEGTDSKVYVTLVGTRGPSSEQWIKLDRLLNLYFEPGSEIISELNIESIGELEKLRIRQDDSGISPHWHLAKVELQHRRTKDWYKFEINKWLSKEKGDKTLEIETRISEYRRPEKIIIKASSTEEKEENERVYSPSDMKRALENEEEPEQKAKPAAVEHHLDKPNDKKDKKITSDDEFDNAHRKTHKDDDLFSDSDTASGSLFSKEDSPRKEK